MRGGSASLELLAWWIHPQDDAHGFELLAWWIHPQDDAPGFELLACGNPRAERARPRDPPMILSGVVWVLFELATLTPASSLSPLGLFSALQKLPQVVAAVRASAHGARLAAAVEALLAPSAAARHPAAAARALLDGSAGREAAARQTEAHSCAGSWRSWSGGWRIRSRRRWRIHRRRRRRCGGSSIRRRRGGARGGMAAAAAATAASTAQRES